MAFSSFSLGMLKKSTPARIRGRLLRLVLPNFTSFSPSAVTASSPPSPQPLGTEGTWFVRPQLNVTKGSRGSTGLGLGCVAPAGTGGAGGMKCFLGMKPGVMAKREKGGKIHTKSRFFSYMAHYRPPTLVFTLQEPSDSSQSSTKMRMRDGWAIWKEDFAFCLHE